MHETTARGAGSGSGSGSGTTLRTTRRTLAKGAAWSVPVVAVAAPAAYAGPSQCTVQGSIQVAPNQTTTIRAICTSQSQFLNPGTISANYATGQLPPFLEICNCQNAAAWYRWRETDNLSNFEIEVDGVHVDQDSPAAGYRTPFFLPGFGTTGGCKRFALTYRTAASRPSNADTSVTITFVLEQGPSAAGPWTQIASITRAGTLRRNAGQGNVDFSTCSNGGTAARAAGARSGD